MIFLQLIFWIALLLIAHTYLFFPIVLKLLAGKKKTGDPDKGQETPFEWPSISVLISAYNEEDVIREKINSVLEASYAEGKIELLVASDASSDRTNEILEEMAGKDPRLSFIPFTRRTGKPAIINHLAEKAGGDILVITDANVMLEKDTLEELARPFENPKTGLVDTRMINTRLTRDGISYQEKFYINREVQIKHLESRLWGSMMGPFGGCYAVRKKNYRPVPAHFLVDDFFINMTVLKQGYRCESRLDARVCEDVSNDRREEFRRKKRISAGNFQNLKHFSSLLFSRRPGVAFCFFSHKVLRWIVPLLVALTLGSSLALGFLLSTADQVPVWLSGFYLAMAAAQLVLLFIPVIDHFLRIIGLHILPLRFISHFVLMNLALLTGFFRFIGGIKSNVWEPTKRNQGAAE